MGAKQGVSKRKMSTYHNAPGQKNIYITLQNVSIDPNKNTDSFTRAGVWIKADV